MPQHESRSEPTGRRPDLWLPPTESGSAPAAWRQPPGWREPTTWQQPPVPPAEPPGGPLRNRPGTSAAGRWPTPAPSRPSRWVRPFLAVVLLGVLLQGGALTVLLSGLDGGASSRDRSPAPPPPARATVPTVWRLEPDQLRPDLPGATFLGSLDGSFQPSYAVAESGVWLTVTATGGGADAVLHALDPATGTVRWQRPLDGALCGTEAPTTGILCASVLQRDPATGLGTRWRLHVLDPATGADRLVRDVDGWLTAVHATASSLVVLEQREPAPHAVLRAFGAGDLQERWTRDLAGEPGQEELFSPDRIIQRPEPERPGLALDRPRLRDVGRGLVALWAGQRTAFVDLATGRLLMMPHCSRLVDDGSMLWCNEVDGVSGYTYAGRAAVRVHGPRLAFPDTDGVGLDRSRPVFLDDDGAGVAVDRRTGAVGAAYTPPGRGSAFGETTMPSVEAAGDATFLVGEAGTLLLDPARDRVVWRNPAVKNSDVPVRRGTKVLLGSSRLTLVELASGAALSELRIDALHAVALGDRVAGVGPENIALLQL